MPLPNFEMPKNMKIYIASTPKECSLYANEFKKRLGSGWLVVGFDCEWRVTYQGPQRKVALIQMCLMDVCVLFHIHHCQLQPELLDLLENPKIFKIGVNISGDILKLARDFIEIKNNSIKGCVDLKSLEMNLIGVKSSNSLSGLVQKYIGNSIFNSTNNSIFIYLFIYFRL